MKFLTTFSFASMAFFSLFLSTSCTKNDDAVSRELHYCPVTRLITRTDFARVPGDTSQNEVDFIYNAAGNPIKATISGDVTPYELGWYNFRYDRQNRLTDYQFSTVASQPPLQWDRYTYLRDGSIIDSLFVDVDSPLNASRPNLSAFFNVATLHPDSKGRVGTATLNGATTTYSYDANGDLIQPGITYDDKVNPLQTNKVWMLLSRNYSVHNAIAYNGTPFASFTYDSHGLPISRLPMSLSASFSIQQDYFTKYFGDNTLFSYGCDVGMK